MSTFDAVSQSDIISVGMIFFHETAVATGSVNADLDTSNLYIIRVVTENDARVRSGFTGREEDIDLICAP